MGEMRTSEIDGTLTSEFASGGLQDGLVGRRTQDVSKILDNIHEMREHTSHNNPNMKLAARVPVPIAEQAMREGWDDEDWKRWLNDPDNKMFRVWPGRV